MTQVIEGKKRTKQLPVAAAPTPMQLIQMALAQGVDSERLKEMMDLQERWEKNEARKEFVAALNAFKANPPDLVKNKRVAFGQTTYDHATLDRVCAIVGKALSEHGLSHRWEVGQQNGNISVSCVLQHARGHSEKVTIDAPPDNSGSKNSIQAVGSTISYLQRYSLLAATGLATRGQDDDGTRAGAKMEEKQRIDFENAIDALADRAGAEELWKTIAKTCRDLGDKATYDELKAKISAKGKTFKEKK